MTSETLAALVANTAWPEARLRPLAGLLDEQGWPWRLGASLLQLHSPEELAEALGGQGRGFSGTRAASEIRLTLAWADLQDSLAEALPRWLPRRALAARAEQHRASARRRFVEIAETFLTPWPQ